MNDKLITALEESLKAMEQGVPLEGALSRYPDMAEEIRPLLLAAQAAREMDSGPIPAQIVNQGRSRLLAQVNSRRRSKEVRRVSPILRFGLVTAVVLAFLAIGGGGLLTASANSLPDDPLYGIKRTAEAIQLDLTFDPVQKDALEDRFYQRRIAETESLLSTHRTVEVKFSGVVEAPLADGWQVSGIHVIVTPQTEISGGIAIGATIEVEGVTQANDTLLAQKIRLETSGNDNGGSSGSGSSGEDQPAGNPTQESGGSSGSDGGSSNSGSGDSGGEKTIEPTKTDSSGSNGGSGEATRTPEPTRTIEPTRTPEPTRTHQNGKQGAHQASEQSYRPCRRCAACATGLAVGRGPYVG